MTSSMKKMIQGKETENDSEEENTNLNRMARKGLFQEMRFYL